jgi:hypothetical protein
MRERLIQKPNNNIFGQTEKQSERRGFAFKRGRILFMHSGNTTDVAKYDQCSCTAQPGGGD